MKVAEWMDDNISGLWDILFRLQISTQVLKGYLEDARPKRFERADGKRYIMRTINVPMPVSDLKNKHTVYYKQRRTYNIFRPQRTIPYSDIETF